MNVFCILIFQLLKLNYGKLNLKLLNQIFSSSSPSSFDSKIQASTFQIMFNPPQVCFYRLVIQEVYYIKAN
jgi:hypothetical protein